MRRLPVAVVVAAMMFLSGCGHQVTGLNQATGGIVPSGQTLIRFETAGPIDPSNFNYLIVFNTTGNGHIPYAQGSNSNYTDWSFGFQVTGASGVVNAPFLLQFYQNPQTGQAGQSFQRSYVPQQVVYDQTFQSALSPYGFEIRFDRCVFNLAPPTATGIGGTPSPPPRPPGAKCPPFDFTTTTNTWTYNLFTVDRTNTVADALVTVGSGTPQPLNTTAIITSFAYTKPSGGTTPVATSAQITGVEIFSTP